jgi:hypothetical protein
MDPNANLAEQLRLASDLLSAGEPDMDDALRLAELVEALHGWIAGGGFLPAQWQSRAADRARMDRDCAIQDAEDNA